MSEEQNFANDPSTVESTRPKAMSEAALAANRANALKSTGPRTAAGKLKAASNSLTHGLYSLKNFENFCKDHDHTLEVVTNLNEQFKPVTPSEHMLTEQLIHLELRFLQMEAFYNRIMGDDPDKIIANPPPFLNTVLREINMLPGRIQRQIKAIHAEQLRRDEQLRLQHEDREIEAIPCQPVLPVPNTRQPKNEAKTSFNSTSELFELFATALRGRDPEKEVSSEGDKEPEETNPIDITDSGPTDPDPANPIQTS